MQPPPGIPTEFDVRTLVFLIRADDAPALDDAELGDLQRRHLAFGADLAARGLTVANGPMRRQTDVRLRGMSVYTVDVEQARELAEQDPMVRAGHLRIEVVSWCVGAGRIEFPQHDGPVGERVTFAQLSEMD